MAKTKEIKSLIINKTKELLKEKATITIKDIAEACFINIAAVNYYFGSKDNLLGLVMKETISDLKEAVYNAINALPENSSIENSFENLVDIIYSFAVDNMGIVRYMFLQENNQTEATSILIEAFFTDNDFTRTIFKNLHETINTDNKDILEARYMLLFSSFSIPLFIQALQENNNDSSNKIATFKDSEFRKLYIKEMIRIIF